MANLKIPPQNLEAEKIVLGSCLLRPENIFSALQKLTPGDFYNNAHQSIFSVIGEMHNEGTNVDLVTVVNKLKQQNKLDETGGPVYIASLTDLIPMSSVLDTHVEIVRQKARLRDILRTALAVVEDCYSEVGEYQDLINSLEKAIFSAQQDTSTGGFEKIGEILKRNLATISKIRSGEKKHDGIRTGYYMLDKILSGFSPGEFVLIGARPSMGKTALAMNMIENMAKNGHGSAIFSMEMNKRSLASRLISSVARIDGVKVTGGILNDEEFQQVRNACVKISGMGIYIDDSCGLTIDQIRSKARHIVAKEKVSSIWIDYLQLGKAEARSREEEISKLSQGCKAMSKELEIPVIALCQLNRSLENRTDKRPILSDLRESGSLEQDADVILFVYRDEVYNKSADNPLKGMAELIIGKQRNGPTTTIRLAWLPDYTRFENWTGAEEY